MHRKPERLNRKKTTVPQGRLKMGIEPSLNNLRPLSHALSAPAFVHAPVYKSS
jgi:hypothetical protein